MAELTEIRFITSIILCGLLGIILVINKIWGKKK